MALLGVISFENLSCLSKNKTYTADLIKSFNLYIGDNSNSVIRNGNLVIQVYKIIIQI